MTDTPMTDARLEEIERIFDSSTVRGLVAEVKRLRGVEQAQRHLLETLLSEDEIALACPSCGHILAAASRPATSPECPTCGSDDSKILFYSNKVGNMVNGGKLCSDPFHSRERR